jgi:glycine cleavage system transcriptional repressor
VPTFAISAMGRDRPGIIAAVAEPLAAHGVNITDSQMGILRGHFALTIIGSASEGTDAGILERDLRGVADRLELEAMTVRAVDEAPSAREEPTHTITVHGADHPGILAAVTAALAAEGANVCDLQTRLAGDVWVMHLEAVVDDEPRLRERLDAVAAQQSVEVVVRPAGADVL